MSNTYKYNTVFRQFGFYADYEEVEKYCEEADDYFTKTTFFLVDENGKKSIIQPTVDGKAEDIDDFNPIYQLLLFNLGKAGQKAIQAL